MGLYAFVKGVDGGLLSDRAVQGLDTTMSTPLRPSSISAYKRITNEEGTDS